MNFGISPSMEIYLIRHTTPKIDKGICYGASDLAVVESFPEEAVAIRKVLPAYHSSIRVVSSPLIRCKQLADFLSDPDEVEIEERFKEMNFGDWELKAWSSIDPKIMKKWFGNFVTIPCPNGESFQEVHDRTMATLQEVRQSEHQQVWIVAHSGIIRAILSNLKASPLKNAFKEKMAYGVVYKIDVDNKITQLK